MSQKMAPKESTINAASILSSQNLSTPWTSNSIGRTAVHSHRCAFTWIEKVRLIHGHRARSTDIRLTAAKSTTKPLESA